MTFDTTVTLIGLGVQIATLVVGGITLYVKIRERITAVETKITPMWSWWSDHRLREREEWTKAMEQHIDHSVRGAVQAALWQRGRGGYEG